MIFKYTAVDKTGTQKIGTIDAPNKEAAIALLQRREMIVVKVEEEGKGGFLSIEIPFLGASIKVREVVILSRQIATLFEAQVNALRIFRLLASEQENKALQKVLTEVADEIQGGSPLHKSLAKHPKVFTEFYTNMVRAGEESGKLNETFMYLADYLDRSYELATKTRNALIYPAFIIATFVGVMIVMLTVVIPRLSAIITESGQDIPFFTQMVIGTSNFLIDYGLFFLGLLVIGAIILWQYLQTPAGKVAFGRTKLSFPVIGDLYRKLYLSRIADNMNTMLSSGISMVFAIEITATVVDSPIYEAILKDAAEKVRGGSSFSDALSAHREIPTILSQMVKIGEETGSIGQILKTLAAFYKREVDNTVETLVSLIEPFMIVALGLGVGALLTSVLIPIYNITSGI